MFLFLRHGHTGTHPGIDQNPQKSKTLYNDETVFQNMIHSGPPRTIQEICKNITNVQIYTAIYNIPGDGPGRGHGLGPGRPPPGILYIAV